jgi:hypothetical protein
MGELFEAEKEIEKQFPTERDRSEFIILRIPMTEN